TEGLARNRNWVFSGKVHQGPDTPHAFTLLCTRRQREVPPPHASSWSPMLVRPMYQKLTPTLAQFAASQPGRVGEVCFGRRRIETSAEGRRYTSLHATAIRFAARAATLTGRNPPSRWAWAASLTWTAATRVIAASPTQDRHDRRDPAPRRRNCNWDGGIIPDWAGARVMCRPADMSLGLSWLLTRPRLLKTGCIVSRDAAHIGSSRIHER